MLYLFLLQEASCPSTDAVSCEPVNVSPRYSLVWSWLLPLRGLLELCFSQGAVSLPSVTELALGTPGSGVPAGLQKAPLREGVARCAFYGRMLG